MIVTVTFLDFSLFLSVFVQIVSIIAAVKFTVLILHCFLLKSFFFLNFFLVFFLYCITIFYSMFFPRYLNTYKIIEWIVNICTLEKCVWLSSVNMLNVKVYTEIMLIAQNDLGLILPLKINQTNRVSRHGKIWKSHHSGGLKRENHCKFKASMSYIHSGTCLKNTERKKKV